MVPKRIELASQQEALAVGSILNLSGRPMDTTSCLPQEQGSSNLTWNFVIGSRNVVFVCPQLFLAPREAGKVCHVYFGHGGLDGDGHRARKSDPETPTLDALQPHRLHQGDFNEAASGAPRG